MKGEKAGTYKLFKTQPMPLSARSREDQSHADLLSIQNPGDDLVNNKQEERARSWLTSCPRHRACSFQQQAKRASQILTYILFKPQCMLLSATSKKGQPDPDLHTVQNPEHDLVSNKQKGLARCWLTHCHYGPRNRLKWPGRQLVKWEKNPWQSM